MRLRHGSWQVILADLALILFLTTLAGLAQARKAAEAEAETLAESPARSFPIALEAHGQAIYRPVAGTLSFGDWLGMETPDPRAALTVHARYGPGQQDKAFAAAQRLAREAETTGRAARIQIAPADRSDVWATLSYDGSSGADVQEPQAQITRSRPHSLAR